MTNEVQLYIEGQEVDIRQDNPIAGSYGIADFSEIQNKIGNRSIAIDLEPTATNRSVMGNYQLISSASTVPYRLLSSKLYVNGIDMKMDKCIANKYQGGKFRIRLFGGNTSFFDYIKDLTLRDIDFSDLNHTWDSATILANLTNTEGFVYPIINYGGLSGSANEIRLNRMFPSVYFSTILEQIIADAGYTLEGDLITDEHFLKYLLPFSSEAIRYGDLEKDKWKIKAYSVANQASGSYPYNAYYIFAAFASLTSVESDPDGVWATDGTLGVKVFTAPFAMTVRVRGRISILESGNLLAVSVIKWDGATASRIVGTGLVGKTVSIETDEIELAAGESLLLAGALQDYDAPGLDYLSFTFQGGVNPLDGEYYNYFEVFEIEETGPDYGEEWNVAANMPDIKIGDWLKYVLMRFGAMISTDDQGMVVNITKFNTISASKDSAKDWSSKVDPSSTDDYEVDYEIKGYGRTTLLKYEDDDTVVKPYGTDSEFSIDNDLLDEEVTLISGPFAASTSRARFAADIAVVDIGLLPTSGAIDYQDMASIEQRVLYAEPVTGGTTLTFKEGTTTIDTDDTYIVPYFYEESKEHDMTWRCSVRNYLDEIILVIQSWRAIRQDVKLTPSDINQLDFMLPVWIEKHEAYFYISLVDQFVFNGTAKTPVKLIRI